MITRLAILGATGSIGTQALEIAAAHPERLAVTGVACARASDRLAAIAARLGARSAVRERDGDDAVLALATAPEVDLVVVAIPGFDALAPTLAALDAGKRVAIAAKEVLVVAGHLVRRRVDGAGERLRPIDSEHSAVWQCLRGERVDDVARIVLTASGGAFRDRPLADLGRATPAEALAHPTWRMGAKVTVDSATLVNKAYEVIEARWLFGVPYERIDVVVHRESVVHALVELADGSVKAQLAAPDMRVPIQYALLYPERRALPTRRIDWSGAELRFAPLDPARYPCFGVVLEAARRGGAATVAVNAADEIAVARFLRGEIRFTEIARELERGLAIAARSGLSAEPELDDIRAFDAEVRRALAPAAVR